MNGNDSSLTIHYPSTLTCYFATGGWIDSPKTKNVYFEINTKSEIIYHGANPRRNLIVALFQANLNVDDTKIPSKERDVFWIQAPIPNSCMSRLTKITCNSGKFLIFIPMDENIDFSWKEFKKVYALGNLGYAIQCSTAKPSPHDKHTSKGIITIHMEDSFDLSAISKVSYKIFETIYLIWPSFKEGVIQYMTDRTTRAKTKSVYNLEDSMLYSISSRSYLNNPFSGDKTPKSLKVYEQVFAFKFTSKAQERQNILRYTYQKFVPKK